MVGTRSNMQLTDLKSKPHGGPSLWVILERGISSHFYPPLVSNRQHTFFTVLLALVATLHQAPTIINFFALASSMGPLTVKTISVNRNMDKNQVLSYNFHLLHRWIYIAFTKLYIIESMINFRVFLHYIHITMYNKIHEKCLHTRLLLYVCARTCYLAQRPQLSQFHTKTHTCFKYSHTIKHFCAILSADLGIIAWKANSQLPQYTHLHAHTFHMSSYTSTYDNIFAPALVDSK